MFFWSTLSFTQGNEQFSSDYLEITPCLSVGMAMLSYFNKHHFYQLTSTRIKHLLCDGNLIKMSQVEHFENSQFATWKVQRRYFQHLDLVSVLTNSNWEFSLCHLNHHLFVCMSAICRGLKWVDAFSCWVSLLISFVVPDFEKWIGWCIQQTRQGENSDNQR